MEYSDITSIEQMEHVLTQSTTELQVVEDNNDLEPEEDRLFEILDNTIYVALTGNDDFPDCIEECNSCVNPNLNDDQLDWDTVIWDDIYKLELSNDKNFVIIENSNGITIKNLTRAINILYKGHLLAGANLDEVEYSFNDEINTVYVNVKFDC